MNYQKHKEPTFILLLYSILFNEIIIFLSGIPHHSQQHLFNCPETPISFQSIDLQLKPVREVQVQQQKWRQQPNAVEAATTINMLRSINIANNGPCAEKAILFKSKCKFSKLRPQEDDCSRESRNSFLCQL